MKAINKMNRLSLKELDSAALILVLQREIMNAPDFFDANKVFDAVDLATYLHRKATRMNRANLPRTPYIEHPLRNTIRLLRAGCYSETVIIATILHDVLEDCADEILTEFLGYSDLSNISEHDKREIALKYLVSQFGEKVCDIVFAVSNGILPAGLPVAEKNAKYAAHVADAIKDPFVFCVKYTDVVDNATGLYHNVVENGDNSGVARRATKYLLIIEEFEKTFESVRSRLPINEDAKEDILATLMLTRVRLNNLVGI